MRKNILFTVISLVVLFYCTGAFAAELHLYAGAGLRVPTDAVIQRFEAKTGHTVHVEYAGMGQLLARYKATRSGDVFLSGSEGYVDAIAKDGGILESYKLVLHTAVMAVRKDKAKGIASYADLAKSDLRLAMGDPKAIVLGRAGEAMLDASGYGDQLRQKVIVRGTTIKQILMYLLNGEVDAAVIGRSDAVKNDSLALLPNPEGTPQDISVVAVLSSSSQPEAAKQLAKFFTQKENIQIFIDFGFLPLPERQ
jgi:molybdenum ABC transporter, periplasmic molybdate-binding protein